MENLKLEKSKRIVFLTGAGMSQESGIKTFRDSNGLWENHSIHEVATPEAFAKNPALVHRFYNARRMQLKEIEPNKGHLAIGELAAKKEYQVSVITQNVDDLHERGGCESVIHMHGELRRILNLKTGESKIYHDEILEEDHHLWRPDIVWFGEAVKHSEKIMEAVSKAEIFIAVGTSSEVYPAAGLFQVAKNSGATTVELNLERTSVSSAYDHSFQGKASEIVPAFIEKCLGIDLGALK